MDASHSAARLRAWRAHLRTRLIAQREALDPGLRAEKSLAIERALEPFVDTLALDTLGFCWPFRAEFDARPLVARAVARGRRAAIHHHRQAGAPAPRHGASDERTRVPAGGGG